MHCFGRHQRSIRFWRFIQQLEHTLRLLAVEMDNRLLLKNLLSLFVGSLDNELVEGGALNIRRGLNRLSHVAGYAGNKTGSFLGGNRHGANLAPPGGIVNGAIFVSLRLLDSNRLR